MYGVKPTTIATIDKNKIFPETDIDDPDYLEKSYIAYFDDEMVTPIKLIEETNIEKTIRAVCDTDVNYIKTLLPTLPDKIESFLKLNKIDSTKLLENENDYDKIRKIILATLFFDNNPSMNIDNINSKIIDLIDQKIQGDRNSTTIYNYSDENAQIVSYKIITAKTLKGFAGLMLKYCPKRNGIFFDRVINKLLHDELAFMVKDKLVALLTNKIDNRLFYYNLQNSRRRRYGQYCKI
jgi:hypothetical protein